MNIVFLLFSAIHLLITDQRRRRVFLFVGSLGGSGSFVYSRAARAMTIFFLRAQDADDWLYKGEGAANLVLSYCGSSPLLGGKVLRIQKVIKGKKATTAGCEFLSRHEHLLWGHIREEFVESISKEAAEQVFATRVMSPLLGSAHIDAGIHITVSREFLECVEKNVHTQRPAWRVEASEINTLCDSALLISDHSVFLSGTLKEDISFAVEIKPKCGFLPSSEFIDKRNATKKRVTRFRMHQLLKLQQGEISRISDYDPLDLFSGSKDRIYRAIMALFATPHNNFRIFLNGVLIYGGLGGGMNNETVQSHGTRETIENRIKTTGLQLNCFLELVAEAIFRSGMLDQLKAAQMLDAFDIEGAIHAYYDIISQPCMVCKKLDDAELLSRYSFLHSLPLEESLKIVGEYLIAATAKDCSVMISFRPRQGSDSVSEYNSIWLTSSDNNFDYKAYFIDLDMKPLKKMVFYYELDQKIVNLYNENEEREESSCKITTEDAEGPQIQCHH